MSTTIISIDLSKFTRLAEVVAYGDQRGAMPIDETIIELVNAGLSADPMSPF